MFLAVGPAGSQAAVKLLPPTTDPQVRSRFLKEVAAAQRVARFCTAQVLDAGIFERRPFIVSEYVNGPSLIEVVEQFGPRGGATLERIAVATLTALGAVHAAGMVHRDFKPANVLLGPDGPVLIDFGLAAVPGMTTMGPSGQVAIGTPVFMAPEQLAAERVTAAADMWSWAVTMVFVGTGELPFKGESLTATAFAILHSEPHVGRLPESLGSLVYRCLNKDPAVRPSARGALSELVAAGALLMGPMPPIASALDADEKTASSDQVLAALPVPRAGSGDGLIAGVLASGPRRRRRKNGRASRRRRAAVLLTLILLVAGAGGLAFTLSLRGPSSERLTGTTSRSANSPLRLRPERRRSPGYCTRSVPPRSCHAIPRYARIWSATASRPRRCRRSGLGRTTPSAPPCWWPRPQSGISSAAVWPSTLRLSSRASARETPGSTSGGSIPAAPRRISPALPSALRARKGAGAQLLTNSNIRLSTAAKEQLLSGQVDPSLPRAPRHHGP